MMNPHLKIPMFAPRGRLCLKAVTIVVSSNLALVNALHADEDFIRILNRPLQDGAYLMRTKVTQSDGSVFSSDVQRIYVNGDTKVVEFLSEQPQGFNISTAIGSTKDGVFTVSYNSGISGGRLEVVEGSEDEISAEAEYQGVALAVLSQIKQARIPGLSIIDPTSVSPSTKNADIFEAYTTDDWPSRQKVTITKLHGPAKNLGWSMSFIDPKQTNQVSYVINPNDWRVEMTIQGTGYRNVTEIGVQRIPATLSGQNLDAIIETYAKPSSVILRTNLTTGSRMQKNGENPWIPSVRPPPPLATPTRWPFYLAFALLTLAAAALPSWLRRRQSAAA
jgi:hypothetical protein